jgi:hypothetical protein
LDIKLLQAFGDLSLPALGYIILALNIWFLFRQNQLDRSIYQRHLEIDREIYKDHTKMYSDHMAVNNQITMEALKQLKKG